MKNEEFQSKLNEMQDKIGEESSSLILDDIGILLNDNVNMNKELESKDNKIKELKSKYEKLLDVNGNLLQQVAMAEEPKNVSKETSKSEPRQRLDFRQVFDKNGNFIN